MPPCEEIFIIKLERHWIGEGFGRKDRVGALCIHGSKRCGRILHGSVALIPYEVSGREREREREKEREREREETERV